MVFELRHFNTVLLRFSATEDSSSPDVKILWINNEHKHLLPLDMELSENGIAKWLKHRTIPKNRAFVHNFLSKCGLNINRPVNIIKVSKGLSLNDCYWVVEDGFEGTFEKYNLYDNRFSRILALISFTGYGSNVRTSLVSCPEFTTNGMLPKCWRRVEGEIRLYKGGTSGASNTGNEPYSEFYAAQVAKALGINAVDYSLSKWEGELCSYSKLFTSKDYSFIPVGKIISGGFERAEEFYKKLGSEFEKAFKDMVLFDALICNTDRHLGNFGFLIDNRTNKIVLPAPLFDHGNSLFNFAGNDDLESKEAFNRYAETLVPCLYGSFIEKAKEVLSAEHKETLRKLVNFKFKKHPRYNLPSKRLKLLEKYIQNTAKKLL